MIRFLTIISILLTGLIYPQQQDDPVVAKAGDIEIRSSEFRDRYDFSPHGAEPGDSHESMKRKFLYSLLAEKLWSLAAREQGIDTTRLFALSMRFYENLILKDILYRREIIDKISLTEDEIMRHLPFAGKTAYFKMIVGRDSTDIYELYKKIMNGASFDSLLGLRPEYSVQQNDAEAVWGNFADSELEEAIFNSEPGKVSSPLKSEKGWVLLKVSSVSDVKKHDENPDAAIAKVKDILSQRKEKKEAIRLRDRIMSGTSAVLNQNSLKTITSVIYEYFERSPATTEFIEGEDVTSLVTGTSIFMLYDIFAKNQGFALSNIEYAMYLSLYRVQKGSEQQIRKQVEEIAGNFIEDMTLAEYAREKGYRSDREAEADIRLRREYVLSATLQQLAVQSIRSDSQEIEQLYKQLYSKGKKSLQVKISVIKAVSSETAAEISRLLKSGSDFPSLSIRYTSENIFASDSGITDFIDILACGEYGRIAWGMKEGDIYGPGVINGDVVFMKLYAKREIELPPPPVDEVKSYLLERITAAKADSLIGAQTRTYALRYGIGINEQVFQMIETAETHTLLLRLLGFGGRILAFPLTTPAYNWYDEKLMKDSIRF